MLMSKRIFGFASVALFATVLVGCDDQHLIGIPQEGAAPVAIITGEQSYDPLATAAFDGSTSYAASPKTIVSYAWAITQRPNGSASQIVSGSACGGRLRSSPPISNTARTPSRIATLAENS